MANTDGGFSVNADTLRAVRALRDLDVPLRAKIAESCVGLRVGTNHVVAESETINDVYFVLSGVVRIRTNTASGRALTYALVRTGGMFGEISAIDGGPLAAVAVAEESTRLACITSVAFRGLARENAAISLAVSTWLAGVARGYGQRVYEFHAFDVRTRICAEVVRLAERQTREPLEGGYLLRDAPTDSDLASRIGTTRENVNRIVNALKTDGVMERVNGGLKLHNVVAMREQIMAAQ
ncbi:MAG: Crp/Fnr family transcriptional regulator [Pseudomonadota bacterium]